jgi:predicted AlkP superfamily pyrophosphatase or phosphodiesterase
MRSARLAALLTAVTLASIASEASAGKVRAKPAVTILISIDGFRPDYLHRGRSPALDALADHGLSGSIRPSFPSKTFPNHYTLVTGLRPDEHGMINNTMVDPRRPTVTFTISDTKQTNDGFWWDEAEPLWVTAEKQGVRSATMFWPGSTAPIHETRPSDWQAFDQAMPAEQRIRSVIDWLRRPAAIRPKFVTLYFDAVDTAGHNAGPDGAETADAVRQVDAAIGALRRGLRDLRQPANIVVVADHGMANVSGERFVDLDMLAAHDSYRLVTNGPIAGIDPAPGKEAEVAAAFVGRKDHIECWPKSALPERFHYGRNPRVPAIVCLADVGWEMGQGRLPERVHGDHGFDPDAPEMAAVFIANGPAFRAHRTLPATDNVNVYPMVAKLIHVKPLANDGDPAILAALARP